MFENKKKLVSLYQSAMRFLITSAIEIAALSSFAQGCAGCQNNLIVNPGFESGNTGFTSGLPNNTDPNLGLGASVYCGYDVRTMSGLPVFVTPAIYQFPVNDHSTGSPSGMVLGLGDVTLCGSSPPLNMIWSQTVTVTQNSDYEFNYWFLAPSDLFSIWINSVQIGSSTYSPCSNYPFGPFWTSIPCPLKWNSGNSTTAVIELRYQQNIGSGYYLDMMFDDLCFHEVAPLTATTAANSYCAGSSGSATVSATGGVPGYTYSWLPSGQTTSTANALTAGTHTVTIVDSCGCNTLVKTVVVSEYPQIVSSFTSTKICLGDSTKFSDSSTVILGSIPSWKWDFGDGSPVDTAQNPVHLFANAGIYNTTLIVKSNSGCSDTITNPVAVYYNPVASFSTSDVCFGNSVQFINMSNVDSSTSIAGNFWIFGDGVTSNLLSPVHYYNDADSYSVILVTTTIDGCNAAFSNSVHVYDPPVSSFTSINNCLFDSTIITNTSVNPTMGTIGSWLWDFGDGSPLNSTIWSPSHLYSAPGNYHLTLITLSSNLGCPDTLKDSITVYPMPVADFSFTNVCLNQAVNFIDSSQVPSGNIAGWIWVFGDGSPFSSIQNPNHTYANPGTFSVTSLVTTNNSCKDSISKSIVVHPLPIANYNTSNVCDGNIVQFSDLATILPTDTILQWTWSFGDGSAASFTQNTSHLYAENGPYTVQLNIVSNFGCMDSISKISVVNPNPVVLFTGNDTVGCEPLCVTFQNSSSVTAGAIASCTWNFGDGSSSGNLDSPNHCYTNNSVFAPNYFTITLTATSDSGCVSTISKNNYITVYPNPVASFTVLPQTTSITDPVISITDLSTGANFWYWNFGDLDTSSATTPSPHTYADTGTYTITLITSTQYNCIDTTSHTVVIEPDFLFYIPNAFTPNDDGINDIFSGKGVFIVNYEMSIFDRWGNKIFFSDDTTKGWDGRANHGNEIAQGDVYIYSIKITDINKRKHSYRGIVKLVR